jgi:hypothetical protein
MSGSNIGKRITSVTCDSLAKRFLSYSKTEIKTLTGILTGILTEHKIGKGLEGTCRLYMEESETAQHVML